MKIAITIILCIVLLVVCINEIDYVVNSYFGNPHIGFWQSVKEEVEIFFGKIKKLSKKVLTKENICDRIIFVQNAEVVELVDTLL